MLSNYDAILDFRLPAFLRSRKLLKLVSLGSLAFGLTILLYLFTPSIYGSSRASNVSSWSYAGTKADARPPSAPHPKAHQTVAYIDDIRAWWSPWISAISAAAPGVSEVKLRHDAASHGPDDPHGARKPAENLLDVTDEDLEKLRASHAQYREFLDSHDRSRQDAASLFASRGVVIVSGYGYHGPAVTTILMLRETGSTLPVEVFLPHKSDYEPMLCKTYLPMLNARCFILEDFLLDRASSSLSDTLTYQLKPLSLIFSSFREVLLLDSDSMPLIAPEQLFDSPAFKYSGMLSWPDFWQATESPEFYKIANLTFPTSLPAASAESGQLLIDKSRHLKTLLLAMYYNVYGPHLYYTIQNQHAAGEGDRTTFEAAAVVLNASYYRVKTTLRTVGRFVGLKPGTEFRGSAMVQFAPVNDTGPEASNVGVLEGGKASKQAAFLHANAPKLDAGILVDDGYLFNEAGEHIRLFGDQKSQLDLFGQDVERKVWDALRKSGCDLDGFMKVWNDIGRVDVCGKLEAHYNALFPS